MDITLEEGSTRRLPSLVQHCQRVAATYVDSICSFDGSIRYGLIKPILESCSPETLLRLEDESPHLREDTEEIWKQLCHRSYPVAAEQYQSDPSEEPQSWRHVYFALRGMETKRFEELGTRLRAIRKEEAERKKGSQIKITDRLPPAKRVRSWGTYQPKTLIQKTRWEAARMQKGIYSSPMFPAPKNYRSSTSASGSIPLCSPATSRSSKASISTPSSSDCGSDQQPGSRVTVTSVTVRRRPSAMTVESSLRPTTNTISTSPTVVDCTAHDNTLTPVTSSPRGDSRPALVKSNMKKDPLSSLFMPKHRALSQLPSQAPSSRSVTQT
ncbi:uncharacterized protein LAESUDRAFT_646941 [Laetiporus sulphureus 93-53]|uniref:Elongin-A n=1 Tax=Laetiporus sulphureus 93-53 TaxID=1314785 RepID=A0A165G226_9APHY|nr:uncharacterized protein LAESUDRAFT_646941 [Laetiporus sulphureus 93-53]KZT09724.1 hypothetical protein LAESUDRAFT_646941 [Laetiporus sulphureus 93-53]